MFDCYTLDLSFSISDVLTLGLLIATVCIGRYAWQIQDELKKIHTTEFEIKKSEYLFKLRGYIQEITNNIKQNSCCSYSETTTLLKEVIPLKHYLSQQEFDAVGEFSKLVIVHNAMEIKKSKITPEQTGSLENQEKVKIVEAQMKTLQKQIEQSGNKLFKKFKP